MVVAEGIAALNSLKPLYELAQKMRSANDPEQLRAAAAQMFDLALAAREQTAALQEERNSAVIELASLKAQIEKSEAFDKEKEGYTRELTHTGATVYREKDASGSDGQSPYYCPHCFSKKQFSIMNPAPGEKVQFHTCNYTCPTCKTSMPLYTIRRRD